MVHAVDLYIAWYVDRMRWGRGLGGVLTWLTSEPPCMKLADEMHVMRKRALFLKPSCEAFYDGSCRL
jgi:hypothetical protein